MLENPIITLTTDFGLKDPFAGVMKGVILGINPLVRIIDITHTIQRHNIFEASMAAALSHKYFPPATFHVIVVDPGVGGMRRPLLVVTEDHYFIGPDNGVFSYIYENTDPHFLKVMHITASHYFLPVIGATFHGRDIFAPVAAWMSKGVDSSKFGEQIDDYVKIPLPEPVFSNNVLTGEIVSIDNFGNAISNITGDKLAELAPVESKGNFRFTFNNNPLPFVNYYAENENGGLSAIVNSFGHVELFVYQDSAADRYGIKIGDRVSVNIIIA